MTAPENKKNRDELVRALLVINPDSKDQVFASFVFTTDVELAAHDLGSAELTSYLTALQDENKTVRKKSATIIGKISPAPKDAVPGLAWALFDPEPEVAREAAVALGNFGNIANKAAPYLVDAFSSKNADVRLEVAATLGKIGKLDTNVLIGMLRATKDKDRRVRKTLKELLTKIGMDQPAELNKAIEIVRG